jgi:hypothetical protein
MANRRRLTFPGPFVRLGNTFFDPLPPTPGVLPLGELTPKQYIDLSRHFLQCRILGDLAAFSGLADFLRAHRNGLFWRDMMLIMSFSMPLQYIRNFTDGFEHDIVKGDHFVANHVFMMLLESGVPEFIERSVAFLPSLDPETDFVEIGGLYAMLLEPDVGYDRGNSVIIKSVSHGRSALMATARTALMALRARYSLGDLPRVHSGGPCNPLDITLGLADALQRPSFYERIYYEKVLLEAMTGHDLRQFYLNLALRPTDAFEALEQLSDAVDLASFVPGARYFFGHPISG